MSNVLIGRCRSTRTDFYLFRIAVPIIIVETNSEIGETDFYVARATNAVVSLTRSLAQTILPLALSKKYIRNGNSN